MAASPLLAQISLESNLGEPLSSVLLPEPSIITLLNQLNSSNANSLAVQFDDQLGGLFLYFPPFNRDTTLSHRKSCPADVVSRVHESPGLPCRRFAKLQGQVPLPGIVTDP